jgi:hypothetical protein
MTRKAGNPVFWNFAKSRKFTGSEIVSTHDSFAWIMSVFGCVHWVRIAPGETERRQVSNRDEMALL